MADCYPLRRSRTTPSCVAHKGWDVGLRSSLERGLWLSVSASARANSSRLLRACSCRCVSPGREPCSRISRWRSSLLTGCLTPVRVGIVDAVPAPDRLPLRVVTARTRRQRIDRAGVDRLAAVRAVVCPRRHVAAGRYWFRHYLVSRFGYTQRLPGLAVSTGSQPSRRSRGSRAPREAAR
jgi:hypothetical protein